MQQLGQQIQPQQPQQPNPQQSRYQLYQMLQAQPTRDTESEDVIKRRAKINAISKGFSGLAGLAGMAVGGDAPMVPDLVTPFNMEQIGMLDSDYRTRLQNWIDQGFQVDQANTGLMNKEIEQGIDAENRMAQIDAQGQNQMQAIQARLQADMEKFNQKTYEEQAKELREVGIDINDPEAYAKYLDLMGKKASADLNYTKARTNWNNRLSSGGGKGGKESFDLDTLSKGVQKRLSQLEVQRKAELQEVKSSIDKQAVNAKYDKLEEEARKYNPGSNELTDREMMQLGQMPDDQEQAQSIPGTPQRSVNFDGKTFTNVPKAQDPVIKGRLEQNFKALFEAKQNNDMTAISEETVQQMMQDLVDSGEAADLEEAYQILVEYGN
jgi:hypothetical protein